MLDMENLKDCPVEIIAYCLMPNHWHLLLKQLRDGGVTDFVQQLSLSYSHFFNTKQERKGPLFQGRFKAYRIETEQQLIHTCRYIHLNPFSSYVVKSYDLLLEYPFSSLGEYIGRNDNNYCQKEDILGLFKSRDDYLRFVLDNADYQRSLDIIKHQLE